MALLEDIEAFLERHETVSATSLGDQALGDRHFVRQLRQGRRVWPETERKVREFMRARDGTIDDEPLVLPPFHEAAGSPSGFTQSTGQTDETSGQSPAPARERAA